jgi:hypothetical protein
MRQSDSRRNTGVELTGHDGIRFACMIDLNKLNE